MTTEEALRKVREHHKAAQEVLGDLVADGVFGPKSQARELQLSNLASRYPTLPWPPDSDEKPVEDGDERVDERSEENIATLLPEVRPHVRALIREAAKAGIIAKVTSGTRTLTEQAKLYAAYKRGGPKAAPAGHSTHNFALAVDVTFFKGDNKTPIWDGPGYAEVGRIGRLLGFNWGGDFGDEPHFSYRPAWGKAMSEAAFLKELRRRNDAGIPVFD